MKTILKVMIFFQLFYVATVCSQINSKSQKVMPIENDESQIMEVTRQLTDLMIAGNTKDINKIVDADFTLTHITGYIQPKSEWFAEIERESMKYYAYEEVKTMVTVKGNKATFIGQNILDARIWGTRNNWRLQQTMELKKKNNKWIIQKSVATTF